MGKNQSITYELFRKLKSTAISGGYRRRGKCFGTGRARFGEDPGADTTNRLPDQGNGSPGLQYIGGYFYE